MQVNCSNCNSNYSFPKKGVYELNQSIITCARCDNYIKVIICPHCKSFYSITFSTAGSQKYKFQCKKCSKAFIVEFPIIKDALKKVNNRRKPVESKEKKGKGKKQESAGNGILFKGKTLTGFNIREIFSICITSFNRSKLFAASLCLITIAILLIIFSALEPVLLSSPAISNSRNLKSFINLFPFALIFCFYILTSALISRITLEEIFKNSRLGIKNTFVFLKNIFGPVFTSNILALVLLNSIFLLFGLIPGVGPVIFSLLFLPIYLISFAIISLSVLGFWFYPPIIAYRNTGFLDNAMNFYHFIKKHNFVLVYIVPILTIVSVLIFSIIYMFHIGAISLSMIFAKGAPGDNIGKLFSSIPLSLLKISEFSLFGMDMGFFKSLMSDVIITHRFGGIILGFIMASISIVLFSSFISIIGTLSTHVYILMERGIDVDDSKKLRLLSILVLILAGIYIVKKVFL